MFAMLKEIAICMVFLYIVLTIAYANRDPWSFYQFQNYENILNGGTFSKSIGNYTVSFVDVSYAFSGGFFSLKSFAEIVNFILSLFLSKMC